MTITQDDVLYNVHLEPSRMEQVVEPATFWRRATTKKVMGWAVYVSQGIDGDPYSPPRLDWNDPTRPPHHFYAFTREEVGERVRALIERDLWHRRNDVWLNVKVTP